MRTLAAIILALCPACRGTGKDIRRSAEGPGTENASVPEHKELGTVPYLGKTVIADRVADGKLAGPETVVHDPEQDRSFVSNIVGDPNALDDNGYISIISPSGEVIDPYFIDGRRPDVELHSPKGMVIGGGTLYVADENGVRLFDKKTGAQTGSWPVPEAQFLNDLAIDAQGRVLATDTGITLLPTGPVKTGPYTIYAFDSNGTKSILAQGDDLHGPNGIVAGPGGVYVCEFMDDEHGVYTLDDKGGKHLLGTLPFGELDGIALAPDGSILVTSWLASGVYRLVPGQPPTLIAEHLTTPAGIDYDVARNRLLIPNVMGNELLIEPWAPPAAKLQPMTDRWGSR